MDEEKLMVFIQKILKNGSGNKSEKVLRQLRDILEMQHTPEYLINYIDWAIESLPEAKEAAASDTITPTALENARIRAEKRKQYEASLRAYGRC